MHKYKINNINPIGTGGEGKVLEVTKVGHGEGEVFVMKQRMCFSLEDANLALSEALALARFQNEYIVGFEDIFIHNPFEGTGSATEYYLCCIVMEYCTGGALFEYLLNQESGEATVSSTTLSNTSDTSDSESTPKSVSSTPSSSSSSKNWAKGQPITKKTTNTPSPALPITPSLADLKIIDKEFLPRDFLIEWMRQICKGVVAIHNAKLVHRDLKSENIFISNNNVLKIGDFGLAILHKNEKVKGNAGTFYYSSPELLKEKLSDRAGDIFSLGCIFYEMATLKLLPIAKTSFGSEILKGTFSPAKVLADFPEDCKDIGELVLQMLHQEPSNRPHVDVILKSSIFASAPKQGPQTDELAAQLEVGAHTDAGGHGVIIRQLLVSDGKAFAEMMSKAYIHDPVFTSCAKKGTEDFLKTIFKPAFKMFQLKRFSVWGYFTAEKRLIGAAVWVPPDFDSRKPSFSEILQVAFTSKAVIKVGLSAIRRFRKITERVNTISTDRECWHLLYCGVDPEFQSRGIGQKLCSPVLKWADQEKRVVTGFLFGERPVHFLQKMGFALNKVDKGNEKDDLQCMYFKREPK